MYNAIEHYNVLQLWKANQEVDGGGLQETICVKSSFRKYGVGSRKQLIFMHFLENLVHIFSKLDFAEEMFKLVSFLVL